eukprot:EG_transcript_19347
MSLTAHSAEIHLSNAQMTDTGRGSEEATTTTNDFETPFLKPLVGPLDMGDSRAVPHQPPITVLLPRKSHSEQLFKVFVLLLVAVLSYFLGVATGQQSAGVSELRRQWDERFQTLEEQCRAKDAVRASWRCKLESPNTGLTWTPIRRNEAGDIECMSLNAKDCFWLDDEAQCLATVQKYQSAALQPLVCGEMHQRVHGLTGYDDPHHWCYTGQAMFPKGA